MPLRILRPEEFSPPCCLVEVASKGEEEVVEAVEVGEQFGIDLLFASEGYDVAFGTAADGAGSSWSMSD